MEHAWYSLQAGSSGLHGGPGGLHGGPGGPTPQRMPTRWTKKSHATVLLRDFISCPRIFLLLIVSGRGGFGPLVTEVFPQPELSQVLFSGERSFMHF